MMHIDIVPWYCNVNQFFGKGGRDAAGTLNLRMAVSLAVQLHPFDLVYCLVCIGPGPDWLV